MDVCGLLMCLHPQKQIKGPNEVLSARGPFGGGEFRIFFVFIFFLCPQHVGPRLVILIALHCSSTARQRGSAGERWGAGVSVHPSPARPRTDRLAANICQAAKAANMWKNEQAPHLRRLTTTVSRPFEDRNMNRTSVKRGDRARRRR